jgi:hypothetical protein
MNSGWSKHLFDMAVIDRQAKGLPLPPQWAGLKFFNVFGPNEYHKGAMMSVLARRFDDVRPDASCNIQVPSRASPTAISGAISSMSTTWCG